MEKGDCECSLTGGASILVSRCLPKSDINKLNVQMYDWCYFCVVTLVVFGSIWPYLVLSGPTWSFTDLYSYFLFKSTFYDTLKNIKGTPKGIQSPIKIPKLNDKN